MAKCVYCGKEAGTVHIDRRHPVTRARVAAIPTCDECLVKPEWRKERAMAITHTEIEDLGFCVQFTLTAGELGAKAIVKLSPNGAWVKINDGQWVQFVISEDATFVNGKKIDAESSGN